MTHSLPSRGSRSTLAALGWDDGWMAALAELGDRTLAPGRVSRVDRGMCTVMTGTSVVRVATTRRVEVAVGDWVGLDPGATVDNRARIVAVLPRRGVFSRRASTSRVAPQIIAANIDTIFLCDALDGSLSLRHLERFVAVVRQSGASPVVLITKSDAVPLEVLNDALAAVAAAAPGVNVVVISAATGDGMNGLAPYLVTGRTVALLGLSGAGKSTLVNLLAGAELVETGPVRRDGTGRHTTTHRELVVLPGGGLMIDTPGMRALSVLGADEGVEQAFQDLEEIAVGCRFTDCSHSGELGCAVETAISEGRLERRRLDSWLTLRSGPESSELKDARLGVAERKRRKAAKVVDRRAAKT